MAKTSFTLLGGDKPENYFHLPIMEFDEMMREHFKDEKDFTKVMFDKLSHDLSGNMSGNSQQDLEVKQQALLYMIGYIDGLLKQTHDGIDTKALDFLRMAIFNKRLGVKRTFLDYAPLAKSATKTSKHGEKISKQRDWAEWQRRAYLVASVDLLKRAGYSEEHSLLTAAALSKNQIKTIKSYAKKIKGYEAGEEAMKVIDSFLELQVSEEDAASIAINTLMKYR